jgi:type VI secretion system FHA domain protein
MHLILRISSPTPDVERTHTVGEEGGTIGRGADNSWVLPHRKVSTQHAIISFRGGQFYIRDTSRNGVAINSPDNRLVHDRPYPLQSGDRLFIEPYEIAVSVEIGLSRPAFPQTAAPSRPQSGSIDQADVLAGAGCQPRSRSGGATGSVNGRPPRPRSRRRVDSGGLPFVAMVEAADFGPRHDSAGAGGIDGACLRRVLAERKARSRVVVVRDVGSQHLPEWRSLKTIT